MPDITAGLLIHSELSDLNEFQRLAARAFDHHGARVTQFVGLLEERHALAPQLVDPGIEVTDTERDVIGQMTAGAHEWTVSLTPVPCQRHIIEGNPRPRHA